MLVLIKGNGLERFIIGAKRCLDQYLVQDADAGSSSIARFGSRINNLAFSAWIKIDQLLLSWMMSHIQENFLSSLIHCVLSQELWDFLTRMFISQTQARIMPIKMQLQTAKKGINDYECLFC